MVRPRRRTRRPLSRREPLGQFPQLRPCRRPGRGKHPRRGRRPRQDRRPGRGSRPRRGLRHRYRRPHPNGLADGRRPRRRRPDRGRHRRRREAGRRHTHPLPLRGRRRVDCRRRRPGSRQAPRGNPRRLRRGWRRARACRDGSLPTRRVPNLSAVGPGPRPGRSAPCLGAMQGRRRLRRSSSRRATSIRRSPGGTLYP
jgi:hypothetical protein